MFSSPPMFAKVNKQYHFSLKRQQDAVGVLELVKSSRDINKEEASTVLVESFIGEYEKYLSPYEIGDGLTSWRDGEKSVQKYYEDYFKIELEEFSHGKVDYWIQASIDGKLVGWATFQREKSDKNSVYMNLLIVHPKYQGKGIGEKLVNSLVYFREIPDLNAINLLLRRKNKGGREFYLNLGFTPNSEYQRNDNFVDRNLLEGFTWKKPSLENKQQASTISVKQMTKKKAAEATDSKSTTWKFDKYLITGLVVTGIGLFALHLKSKGSHLKLSDTPKLNSKF